MKLSYLVGAVGVAALAVSLVFTALDSGSKPAAVDPYRDHQAVLAFTLNQQFQAEGASLRVTSVYDCVPGSCDVTVKAGAESVCVNVTYRVNWRTSVMTFRDVTPIECEPALAS